MKLAFVTDDEIIISAHFGRAVYYLFVTIEDGKVVHREKREKLNHAHFANELQEAEAPGKPHGFESAARDRHGRMMKTIADCEVLVSRGMGLGAYENLKSRGIQPILTEFHGVN